MKKSKLETAKNLARAHSGVEPNLKKVFLIEPLNDNNPNDPIKLLEVVEGTIERGIDSVSFAPDPVRGIEYPSIIVEISPTEYENIQVLLDRKNKLGLSAWKLGEQLWPIQNIGNNAI